ncbi:hypothetical protein [Pseudoduganella lutea]|uniref:Uncharacterized protein n=1 Tax=Pseudoduganella lutea TaxID=321985 RepID=A0A4P6L488_9BURK|nr:hypothetical protein [Pseudoduganella lutea]QBE66400.1 hypothetical protein EWM63_28355 [Pseudoduganella lutea]
MSMRLKTIVGMLQALAALIVAGRATAAPGQATGDHGRQRVNIDQGWRFAHGHVSQRPRRHGKYVCSMAGLR